MAQALVISGSPAGTGQVNASIGAPGGGPFATYALQVKGVGGTPTSWSVTLDGSLDNTNWTTLITHTTTDGSTSYETTGKPNLFVRVNVGAVTLGPASALLVKAVAVP
jgi:hypothetical protein